MKAWAVEELQNAELGDVRGEHQQLERLQQAIRQVHPCGQLTLELRRHPECQARLATLTLRTTTVELQPPATHPERERLQPINVQVVLAEEENPPMGVQPVSWLLVTTLAVTCFDDVVQCLPWYSYRWLIERYHYLRSCVRWIAQLGRFLARNTDGEPGVKTLWQGLRRLHDIAQTWLLLSPKTTSCVKSNYLKKDVANA